jgi:hypothetical protein
LEILEKDDRISILEEELAKSKKEIKELDSDLQEKTKL